MSASEQAIVFDCAGDRLLGILSAPAEVGADTGVLIVVGGAQYRIGSHRQFALLARHLAASGIPALRFDLRGMGDSEGEPRDFTEIDDDIAAAIAAFQHACPDLRHVVLWGLCDAASAALLYWQRRRDPRLAGMVLLNPWVRSESGLAQAHVSFYYPRRLMQRAFWQKLFSGKVALWGSLRELWRSWRLAQSDKVQSAPESFQSGMAAALRDFPGPRLILLSGQDLTAQEFITWADAEFGAQGWRQQAGWHCVDLPEADHTFARPAWREEVETLTRDWVKQAVANRG